LQATAIVNVTVRVPNPTVTADYINTVFNTNAYINPSTLLANDLSPGGVVGQDIVFTGLVPCAQLDATYCKSGQPTIVNGQIVMPFTQNSCKSNKFRYCISYAFDPSATMCGDVTVSYTNCQCIVPIDIVFVLDSSGSITSSNWTLLMDMLQKIVDKLNLGAGAIQAAFVQYGSNVRTVQKLTSNRGTLNTQISWLRKNHMSASTATGPGLNRAITVAQDTTRSPSAFAKVVMLFTDGISNSGEDPVPIAKKINSWTNATIAGNPTPGVPWKLVAAGIGNQLFYNNNAGWNQVKAMNYDAAKTLQANFDTLDSLVTQVVDTTCDV